VRAAGDPLGLLENMAIKTRTAPCTRFVLVRIAQCVTHVAERSEGVQAAMNTRYNGGETLTERGVEMARRLSVEALTAFARGPYALAQPPGVEPAEFSQPRLYIDETDAAARTAEAAGWNAAAHAPQQWRRWSDADDEDDKVNLVFLIASSREIANTLEKNGIVYDSDCVGLPLGSITMFDVVHTRLGVMTFHHQPFIHCIGNTSLNPEVAWWHNSNV
jgi:hypothetical protein